MSVASDNSVLLVRPWVRLFARKIDLLLFGFLYDVPVSMINQSLSNKYVITCFLVTFLWVPVEALFLTFWGTTPGKWLLQTHLSDLTGRFSFIKELRRSLDVWIWGMGVGFVWATWVGLLYGYLDLQNRGTTRWDRAEETCVTHRRIGLERVVGTIVLVFCFAVLTTYVQDIFTGEGFSKPWIKLIGMCMWLTLGWITLKYLVFEKPQAEEIKTIQ